MSTYEMQTSTGSAPNDLLATGAETTTGHISAFVSESLGFKKGAETGGSSSPYQDGKKKEAGSKLKNSNEQTERFNLRTQLRNALEASERLMASVEAAEPVEMEIAGAEIIQSLSKAAKYKNVRERNWFQALTVTHGALARCEFAKLKPEAALGIHGCIEVLSQSVLDESDLNTLRREMRSGGLNPWSGIARRANNDDEKQEKNEDL